MTFSTLVTAAAFFVFGLVSTTQRQEQAPVQVSTQAQTLQADDDVNALLGPAAAGDAQAQFALATDYIDGRGIGQDYGQAVIWYRKSADQGYAPALNQLGYMHQHKFGLPRDYKRALYYYRLAADKGNARAEYNLGAMYQGGLQVRRDYKQAFAWYRKAADQNLADAENEVGYFYQCGWGVKRDYAQALDWYGRAASHGSSNAETNLGFMAEKGWGEPQSYEQAFSWYYTAAEHGNAEAMENIGYNFQNAVGVDVDYAKAWSWLVQAAALGSATAENQLGWMYQYGEGVQADASTAVALYRLSADQGNSSGNDNLRDLCVDLYESGNKLCHSGSTSVSDPAIEMIQRQTQIRDLRAQITGLETDALQDDTSADDLANMGKNGKAKKENAITKSITKVMDGVGTALSVNPRLDAANLREQAARLRVELAQLESLDESSANVPPPAP
jgi:TPR repeat protein